MADYKDLPDAIQWHEGMLLSPHHFQQAELRGAAIQHYHTSLVSPFHWGVRRLKLDNVLLMNGLFRVLELEAVMPDGLVVGYSAEEGDALELDLVQNALELGTKPLPVHLVLPAQRPGSSLRSEYPRYTTVPGQPVPDVNTGEGEMRIPRLRPRLGLLLAEEPPAQFVSLPLARVQYKNQNYGLTEYVPPQLEVRLDSPVGEMCRALAKRLREKAGVLSDKARSPSLTMGSPLLLETKGQVASIVAALPQFEAVLSTGVAHPYALYLALCGVVGQISSLGSGLLPPTFEPYDHNDLRLAYDAAIQHIDKMLKEGILEAYTAFPFEQKEPGDFRLGFIWTWMGRELVLGVRAQQGVSESEVVTWVQEALVGSAHIVPSLRENRVLGAARTRVGQNADLVPSRGVVLFELNVDPRFIESNEELQIVNVAADDRPHPAEIVLYVKNR